MSKQKVRERLTLKAVGLEHLDQFNQLLRYVFQVTNEELFKSGYEDGELIRAKRPMLERADVFGWFDGDNLISQVIAVRLRSKKKVQNFKRMWYE